MKKRSFVLIVSLVIMIFGLTSAVVEETETVTTITCKPGSQLAGMDAVNQLCDAAAFRIHYMPEGTGAFALSLNDVDTLSSLLRVDEDGAYLQSAMLGDTPLYFSWEALAELLLEQMEGAEDMYGMNNMFNPDMMQAMMDDTMTEDQMYSMMGMDAELLEFIGDIEAAQMIESGAFTIDGSDVATQKTVTVLTNEDLIRAVELLMMRERIILETQMSSPTMDETEAAAEVDAQLAEIKQVIVDANLSVTSTVLTTNDELIAFETIVNGVMDENHGATDGGVKVTMTKTSINTAKFYQLFVRLYEGDHVFENQYGSLYMDDGFATGKYTLYADENEPLVTAAFNCDTSQPDQTISDISFTVFDGSPASASSAFIVFDQRKADNVTDTVIDVFTGGSVDEIKKSLTQSGLISLNIHTVTQPDSGFFADLQSATPESSVQLLAMTEAELDAYMVTVEQPIMMTLMTLIENLPPEISNSLMQGVGGF